MNILKAEHDRIIEEANKNARTIANQKVIIFDYKNQIRELTESLDEMHTDNKRYCKELNQLIEERSNLIIKCSELENKLNNRIG